jgi:hypothetical protein
MSSRFSTDAMNPFEEQPPSTCHLLKIPLELRDIIYEMLLTTPYCTITNTRSRFRDPHFHLHPAILLVNRQVSAEAQRVLYQGNDFITFETTGFTPDLGDVPTFPLLSADKITRPVLRVKVSVTHERHDADSTPTTIITTAQGIQSIISAHWACEAAHIRLDKFFSLSLDFKPKAASHYHAQSQLILKPWDMITGLKELELLGDVKEPMREYLEKSLLEPFPDHVVARLKEFDSKAEQEFKQKNFEAAYRWWLALQMYFAYLFVSPCCMDDDETYQTNGGQWAVLRKSYHPYSKGALNIVKEYLRQSQFEDAIEVGYEACCKICWDEPDFDDVEEMPAIMLTKFKLCTALARTALGRTAEGMEDVETAAAWLLKSGLINGATAAEITGNLRLTVDNELIRLRSPWRCGHPFPINPDLQDGQIPRRLFWDWLDLPDERDRAVIGN